MRHNKYGSFNVGIVVMALRSPELEVSLMDELTDLRRKLKIAENALESVTRQFCPTYTCESFEIAKNAIAKIRETP